MKFLIKIGITCVFAFTILSCNIESDLNESEKTSELSTTSKRERGDDYRNNIAYWYGEETIWYKIDPVTGFEIPSHPTELDALWKCGGLGNDCVDSYEILCGSNNSNENGLKVLFRLRNNVLLELELLESHITHEEFFSNTIQNENSMAIFEELLNFVNLSEDVFVTDNKILDRLNLQTDIITIPAGKYQIDFSKSEYGTVSFPIEY